MDNKNIATTTPEEHQLITKLYGPDPHEGEHRSEEADDSTFVFDIEDMALVGRPDDPRKRPPQ